MSRERWVVGNWKMIGDLVSNAQLLSAIRAGVERLEEPGEARVGICVPMPYLYQACAALEGSRVVWGAQDASAHASGAYTGETSAGMLVDFGAKLCIVGHSERRAYHREGDDQVAAKAAAVHAVGLRPIVCVGETLEQRQAGRTFEVVEAQLGAVLARAQVEVATMLVAYEPVWAIGTGQTATPQQAQDVHAHVRKLLSAAGAAQVPILYGGSVKASNAAALFAMPDIDGGLIGGASRVADEFLSIVASCAAIAEA